MPAPKKPNTAAATAAVRRRGEETMAAKLRARGWTCTPPEAEHKRNYDVPPENIGQPIDFAGPTGRELPGEHWNARIIRETAEAAAHKARLRHGSDA